MSPELESEFRVIDANHQVHQRMRAEIEILRTRLRIARGEFVPVTEMFRLYDNLERYPEFREPGDKIPSVV